MRKPLTLAIVAVILTAPAFSQDEGDETPGFTIANGRVTYRVYCASCHGREALGDGHVAQYLTVRPADLTLIKARNGGQFPRAEVAAIIDGRTLVKSHGTRDMPIWGDVFQSSLSDAEPAPLEDGEGRAQRKIQELVRYLESIQSDP